MKELSFAADLSGLEAKYQVYEFENEMRANVDHTEEGAPYGWYGCFFHLALFGKGSGNYAEIEYTWEGQFNTIPSRNGGFMVNDDKVSGESFDVIESDVDVDLDEVKALIDKAVAKELCEL